MDPQLITRIEQDFPMYGIRVMSSTVIIVDNGYLEASQHKYREYTFTKDDVDPDCWNVDEFYTSRYLAQVRTGHKWKYTRTDDGSWNRELSMCITTLTTRHNMVIVPFEQLTEQMLRDFPGFTCVESSPYNIRLTKGLVVYDACVCEDGTWVVTEERHGPVFKYTPVLDGVEWQRTP